MQPAACSCLAALCATATLHKPQFPQAAYSLWLRAVMTRMGPLTAKSGPVNELGMVVYNNLLSIPMIAALAVATGEVAKLPTEPALRNPTFLAAACGSALMSFLISIASMWFLSCTTATTFSLVGSLNKIPLAALGMVLFSAPTNANNLASILLGLVAGVVFVHAKSSDARRLAAGGGSKAGGGGDSGSGGGGGVPVHAHAISVLEKGSSGELRPRDGVRGSRLR